MTEANAQKTLLFSTLAPINIYEYNGSAEKIANCWLDKGHCQHMALQPQKINSSDYEYGKKLALANSRLRDGCRVPECTDIEAVTAYYEDLFSRINASDHIIKPTDIAISNNGKIFHIFQKIDESQFTSLWKWLPLCSGQADKEAGSLSEQILELVAKVHQKNLAFNGLRPDQIWVKESTGELYISADGYLTSDLENAGTLPRYGYTLVPPKWSDASGYSVLKRDTFSAYLLSFWLRIGLHPMANRDVCRWVCLKDKTKQYFETPVFIFNDDYPNLELGFSVSEREARRVWDNDVSDTFREECITLFCPKSDIGG